MATVAKGFHDERYRMLIGELIAARKASCLSQRELAERLGRHQQFVSRYETGERRLDVIEYADIAISLDIDPAQLLASQLEES